MAVDRGLVGAGDLVVGAHTVTFGALNAFAIGVDRLVADRSSFRARARARLKQGPGRKLRSFSRLAQAVLRIRQARAIR